MSPVLAVDWAQDVVVPHPAEFLAGAVCFAVLLLLCHRVVVPRLEAMLARRRAVTEGGMEKAERARAEADAALAEYRGQLASARAEAAQIREEARAAGARIVAEAREQAAVEAESIVLGAGEQVAQQRAAAVAALDADVAGLATDLASRIVGEDVSEVARRSGVVQRFLADRQSV